MIAFRPGSGRPPPGPDRVVMVPPPPLVASALTSSTRTKVYVLVVIEHGTRRIRVLGATESPVQSWVVQQARNLLMDLDDAGMSVKFALHDRDASFTAAFDSGSTCNWQSPSSSASPSKPASSAPSSKQPPTSPGSAPDPGNAHRLRGTGRAQPGRIRVPQLGAAVR